MKEILLFIMRFIAAQAILTAIQTPLRKKRIKPVFHALLIAGKALLAIGFAVIVLAGPVQLRALQPLMMALYVALFADAAADLLYTVICAIRKKERAFATGKALSLIFGILFLTFGIWNMETVVPAYHTYTSEKIEQEHTVVFIADLHVGSAQPFTVTEKTVEKMKDMQPDATILGGDIVDDYTTKEEMEAVFKLFSDFTTPVYYVYGNHDRQGHAQYAGGRKFTPEELEDALKANGIVILKDEYADIAPDLVLLGREDMSENGRKDTAALTPLPSDAFLLVADHQPNDFKAHAALGADLQISGHTHAGQLFPLGIFYSAIGYCRGEYQEGDSTMLVSSGVSGWRCPLRTDARCNIEVITLSPAVK